MKFASFLARLSLAAVAVLLLAAAPEARAAVFACTNNEIQGDVTAPGFEGCIGVLNFGEAIQMPLDVTSPDAGRTTGNPTASPFRLIKSLDRTSPVWRDKLLTGTSIAELTINFVTNQNLDRYFEIKLTDALVAEISMTTDQNGVPTEVISIEAAQVQWTYTPYDGAGNQGPGIPASWNFASGGAI